MISARMGLTGVSLVAALAGASQAALTWPECKDVTDAEIHTTVIASKGTDNVVEPMKMAFDLVAAPGEDAKDKVDIYFTERLGNLRKWDSKQKKVVTLGHFSLTVGPTSSDGLLGIALDPNFKTNHNLFLYYTYKGTGETSWRVSRFTLDAQNQTLDMASEKVVIKIPMIIGAQHPGGALQFDAYGDLWITTGNDYLPNANEFPVWSSGNTNDLRGKILRIHPTADGKYTVPTGNLFPEGTDKALPEIFVMGARNPYTMALDPVRRWAVWGDVGPDGVTMDGKSTPGAATEEDNLTIAAGNFGYPFFAGKNFSLKDGVNASSPVIPAGTEWGDATAGLMTLPAAQPALHAYSKACAITGPIYRYDGDLNSSIKFPPHFNRKWFITDFNPNDGSPITLITLSDDGKTNVSEEKVLSTVKIYKPLDFQQGPDGALYVNSYAGYRTSSANTGIVRIEYTGDCRPPLPKLEPATSIGSNVAIRSGARVNVLQGAVMSVQVFSAGEFSLQVLDLLGRPVASRSGRGNLPLALQEVDKPGIYFLSVDSREGHSTRKIVRE
jgi:cytochrome c